MYCLRMISLRRNNSYMARVFLRLLGNTFCACILVSRDPSLANLQFIPAELLYHEQVPSVSLINNGAEERSARLLGWGLSV
jgi:hypothetical protein